MGDLRRLRKGVLTLELALVLPILLLVLLAVVQFASSLMAIQTVQAAALVGAREAAMPGASETSVKEAVARALGPWRFGASVAADPHGIEITPDADPSQPGWQSPPAGSPVAVTVRVEALRAAPGSLARLGGTSLRDRYFCGQYVMRKE